MTDMRLYNNLTRKKEVVTPLKSDHVTVYACGPTVYNYAHIGNARMAVVFDLLARVLKEHFPKVTYVSNITDVDDKIMKAAQESGQPISEITEKYTAIYNDDMASLGVAEPDIQPKATDHIGEMIAQIEKLIEAGHAYEADGHVLFDVPSFPKYGGLSGRSRDEQIAGARVDVASYKRDPADFVLWKPSTEAEPGWDSPWGRGRPGWHIECSAMAEKHLGLPFDIHGGGADLKFPHHENEIAQSCCANGNEDDLSAFAKMWVHNGFVTVDGEKMAKSAGNFLLVHDLIEEFPGEALRLTLLSAHYRQPLDWSAGKVAEAKKVLDRLYNRLEQMADMKVEDGACVPAEFLEALSDDLNTPAAMAALSGLLREENSSTLKGQLLAIGNVMGILQMDPAAWLGFNEEDSDIDALIAARNAAKADKDWVKADALRDEIVGQGIIIEDSAEGTKWRRA